jgi:hypothetical protein
MIVLSKSYLVGKAIIPHQIAQNKLLHQSRNHGMNVRIARIGPRRMSKRIAVNSLLVIGFSGGAIVGLKTKSSETYPLPQHVLHVSYRFRQSGQIISHAALYRTTRPPKIDHPEY